MLQRNASCKSRGSKIIGMKLEMMHPDILHFLESQEAVVEKVRGLANGWRWPGAGCPWCWQRHEVPSNALPHPAFSVTPPFIFFCQFSVQVIIPPFLFVPASSYGFPVFLR